MESGRMEAGYSGPDGKKARVIGVTGGVGAGKSRILAILEKEYGAQVILADQVAARLEEPGGLAYKKLVGRFGAEILAKDGHLDRKAFAERIFKDKQVLAEVNAMVHPLVWQEICRMVEESSRSLIVVEAALFGRESREICDMLWYVDADEESRIARLTASRGYSREKCRAIMNNQPGREYFLALADVVIDNKGTVEETRRQIGEILERV